MRTLAVLLLLIDASLAIIDETFNRMGRTFYPATKCAAYDCAPDLVNSQRFTINDYV